MGRTWAFGAALSLAVSTALPPVPSLRAADGDEQPAARRDAKPEKKPGEEKQPSAGKADPPAKQELDLFQFSHVWNVHLTFTPEQWAEMEPRNQPRGFRPPPQRGRGGPGEAGGPRGPGGPGGPPGPRGPRVAFGPSTFLVPAFLKEDQDKDGKLSKDEFAALAEKFFTLWDKDKSGRVSGEQLRVGLNTAIADANPNAGRPPGLNLQGPEGKRNGLASAMGVEFTYVHADLEFDDQLFKDVAVRYKGNGTWLHSRGSMKKSMKIDLNEFVKGQKLAGIGKLNLHSNATDASLMNEVMSYRLYRDAGVPAPRTSYARVFVTVPGKHDRQYLGVYSIVENIDKDFARRAFKAKGGAILKPVTPAPFTDLGDDWAAYQQTYDPKTGLSDREKKRIIEFCKLVSHADEAEFAAKIGDYLDLDAFANYMAVTVYLSTLDSILGPGQNYYAYLHPESGKLHFLPWDLDHSFGQFFLIGNQDQRDNLSIRKPWLGKNRFLERVFNHKPFYALYLARLQQHGGTTFQPERFERQVDEIAAAIRPAVQDEPDKKLESFDKAVAGEAAGPAVPAPMRLMMPGMRTRSIKPFVKARTPLVLAQLSGKSDGDAPAEMGFGPRLGPGAGPGGGFGPGNFLGPAWMAALDADKDGSIVKAEAADGFSRWFASWNTDNSGKLTDQQLRAGIDKDLSPGRPGPPGGPAAEAPGGVPAPPDAR